MNSQNHYLTTAQKEELKQKLSNLKNVLLPKNSEALEEAKAQGDLSENAEYDAAKDEQGKLNHEVSKIENILANATIIRKNSSTDKVDIGHAVTIKWDSGQTETVNLLGFGDGEENVSVESPLGKALLGKKANQKAVVEAPIGRLHLTILTIE